MSMTKVLTGLSFVAALAWGAAANATTVVVPDVGGSGFQFFGNGNASVTYDGVTFSQSALLSDGNFFNVSPGFSGVPDAVVSSQEETTGSGNILITLPSAATSISIDFGTFLGGDVTFALSNGQTFTVGSTDAVISTLTPDVFTYSGASFTSVQITADGTLDSLDVSQLTFGVPGASDLGVDAGRLRWPGRRVAAPPRSSRVGRLIVASPPACLAAR